MANAFYTLGIERFLKGSISWNSDTIKIQFIDDTNYTPNLSTHEYLSDVSNTSWVGSATALASKGTTGGKASAANTTVASVSGSTIKYILIYKDTGTPSSSPLICLIDTATGLPYTPTGSDIVVVWDTGTNGIFLLALEAMAWIAPFLPLGRKLLSHLWRGRVRVQLPQLAGV